MPIAVPLIPPAYHHWIPAIIRLTIKSVAVFIAWQLQIVISAVQVHLNLTLTPTLT